MYPWDTLDSLDTWDTFVHFFQDAGQPGRNGQILRKVKPFKTEPGRNRKYEQTNHKQCN